MNTKNECAVTYNDLYRLLFWSTVLVAAVVLFVNLDTYKLSEQLVTYADRTAYQYLHMRGKVFSHAEKREDGKSDRSN